MSQSAVPPVPSTSALDAARAPVDALLAEFLEAAVSRVVDLDPALRAVAGPAAELVRSGGKRLRPAFVHWGAVAAGACVDVRVHAAGAAVELLHAFALIHDDVMDRAAWRRGRPAVHREMAAWHRGNGLRGDAEWFGVGAAMLAGDLVFVWADELFDRAVGGLEHTDRCRQVFNRLRVEVMAGQYLDLRLAGLPEPSLDEVVRVALLKSGRYTVTRPLQLGAALAGGHDERLHTALERYGDALGVAFQLRDDVLGLFGDPAHTGKEALTDLREGKRTLLILRALESAGEAERTTVRHALGDPALDEAGAQAVRDIVRESGALSAVEAELDRHLTAALQAVGDLAEPARSALWQLARTAAHRLG